MTADKPTVMCFLSGKGGSGKTTVTIAISKLMSDIGFPCLLIDFDIATNGGSCFFSPLFNLEQPGICELLSPKSPPPHIIDTLPSIMDTLPIIVNEDFLFVPSSVKLRGL